MLCLFGADSVCEFLQGHGATLLRQACGQLWPRGHMRLASKSGPNKSLKGRVTAALLAMRWFASIGIWICLPACVWHVHLFACSMLACLHTAHWLVFHVCVQVKVSQPSTHTAFVRLAWTLLGSRCFCLACCLSTKCLLKLVHFMACQFKVYVMQCVSKPE